MEQSARHRQSAEKTGAHRPLERENIITGAETPARRGIESGRSQADNFLGQAADAYTVMRKLGVALQMRIWKKSARTPNATAGQRQKLHFAIPPRHGKRDS